MLIQGKILSYGHDLSEVMTIRRKVFIEEMNIPEDVEFDEQDTTAMHVIVYEEAGGKKAVATGRICFDGTDCEIGHIAVLKEFRHKKYGDFAVRMLLNKAFTAGITDVSVISFAETTEFFETIGFRKSSDIFSCNNHNYFKMKININNVITACKK